MDPTIINVQPEEAARRLGLSKRAIFDLIAAGELRSFRQGKRRLIPVAELTRWTERKLKAAS
jgi:excisionase family DNA binding protein